MSNMMLSRGKPYLAPPVRKLNKRRETDAESSALRGGRRLVASLMFGLLVWGVALAGEAIAERAAHHRHVVANVLVRGPAPRIAMTGQAPNPTGLWLRFVGREQKV